MKKLKKIPIFKSEDSEREFWASHSASDYLDFSKAKTAMFPRLKPTTRPISLRMPAHLLERIMMLANKDDVPYQSFIKTMLSEAVDKKLKKAKV
ncbi:MAG: BrnA antitoxin family protein [Nitrospinae bacterium]|nr:BrnA antitoxin family protein [Nitrospinota bacterium]